MGEPRQKTRSHNGEKTKAQAQAQVKTRAQALVMRRSLLKFYDDHGRTLPWRIRPEDRARGVVADPYAIWLSEIMCQQTSVVSAAPYWRKFLHTWPSVADLARADRDDVLAAWAGLGYYARARNLHKCAQVVIQDYEGEFPTTEQALLSLPGIGAYTAAAMAAICWGEATNVVDGNVERVISRIFAVKTVMPKAKTEIRTLAVPLALVSSKAVSSKTVSAKTVKPTISRSGDYAQALMDLGAHICTPKNPKCKACPWAKHCMALAEKSPETYPVRAPKKTRPVRYGAVFYLEHEGRVFLRKRPDQGLLGGMIELPSSTWIERTTKPVKKNAIHPDMEGFTTGDRSWLDQAPAIRNWQLSPQIVHHVFTHFTLYLRVYHAQGKHEMTSSPLLDLGCEFWADLDELSSLALPTVMQKALLIANSSLKFS